MKPKHLLMSLLALMASLTAFAETWTDSNGTVWTFTITNSLTKTVELYNDNRLCIGGTTPNTLSIPSTVYIESTAYTVTSIGKGAFKYLKDSFSNITTIIIPYGVTTIGEEAFYYGTKLTSITIPASVTTIGKNAFLYCRSLTSLTIPEGVTTIGESAFSECSGLTSIVIPNTVTTIDRLVFASCSSLTSITIPGSVTSIGFRAFFGCSSLTSIEIPNSIATIDRYAFEKCSGLTSFTIPGSVTTLGEGVFYGCSDLASIDIPESITSIPAYTFNTCTSLTSIAIPESVTSIGNNAFYGSGLTSVVIPSSVTSIGDYAFMACRELSSITIPESVTSIARQLFSGCTSLTSINIPNSVTSISNSVFFGCTGLTSITIPKSVISLGSNIFSDCSNLTSITVEWETPMTIDYYSFHNSLSVSNITLFVPYGCKATYEAARYWQDFGNIIEMPNPNAVVVGSTGYATFCSPFAQDFSGMTDIRAYIASGFNPATGNLLLTRVTEVPAGEGLYIVGTEGSYDVPKTTTSMYYSNLLKGVTTATNISPTDGDMTNFILSDGSYGVGFYPVSTTGELAGGKAYLQLPTALLGNNVKAVSLIFDDVEEDDPTGIVSPLGETEEGAVIYNLAGQRIQKMQKGINIVGGKKIFVK